MIPLLIPMRGGETDPVYGVPLLAELPLGDRGGMVQALPSRRDLIACESDHSRVAAGFAVVTAWLQETCRQLREMESRNVELAAQLAKLESDVMEAAR